MYEIGLHYASFHSSVATPTSKKDARQNALRDMQTLTQMVNGGNVEEFNQLMEVLKVSFESEAAPEPVHAVSPPKATIVPLAVRYIKENPERASRREPPLQPSISRSPKEHQSLISYENSIPAIPNIRPSASAALTAQSEQGGDGMGMSEMEDEVGFNPFEMANEDAASDRRSDTYEIAQQLKKWDKLGVEGTYPEIEVVGPSVVERAAQALDEQRAARSETNKKLTESPALKSKNESRNSASDAVNPKGGGDSWFSWMWS